MKSNFTKKILTVLLCFMTILGMLFLVSCGDKAGGTNSDPEKTPGENNNGNSQNGDSGKDDQYIYLDSSQSEIKTQRPNTVTSDIISSDDLTKLYWQENKAELNPKYSSRTESLDNIFNPDALGQMVLVFDRSEWNKHLDYCDINLNHEESVIAKGFYFTKDNKEWYFNDIGFRIRGNTSRRRPQLGTGAGNNDYVQAHFALDFEEWTDDDKKLADCMKGVILKRFKDDATYSREVYAYNLFRQNGIWLSPRAAYTRLIIQIQESDGTFETVDYGVYAMIEEIKKQFLKERTENEGGGFLSSNKGNLWKCLYKAGNGADFVYNNVNSIGEESIEPIKDGSGNITGFSVQNYDYDYKDDNDFEEDGKPQLLSFMQDLANLPDCTDGKNDKADVETIRTFYNEKMAGDLFLRTYAINVILGMWDDYWVNKNNFYFYFDKDGKAYFIPYDYDNCLGVSNLGIDAGTQNPYKWGSLTSGDRPLIQKILQVPEFMELYKKYLLEYSDEDSFFDDDKSIAQIKKWHSMIEPYIYSPNLQYQDTTNSFNDVPASWGSTPNYTLYTEGKNNFFTVRQKAIKESKLSATNILTLDADDGFFWTGSGDGTHQLYYNFSSGDTLSKILSSGGFQGWSVKLNNDGLMYGKNSNGRYYFPDGFCYSNGDYVYSDDKFYESETLHTNWVDFTDAIVPYYFDDWETISFVCNPTDFEVDFPENANVYLMSANSNLQPSEDYKLSKQDGGTYSIKLNMENDFLSGLNSYNGYKFYISDTETWLGYQEYKHELPVIFAEDSGDSNFRVAY